MAAVGRILRTTVVQPVRKQTATLFIFHGSGDKGNAMKGWIDALNQQELTFPHVKIIYPTAPSQPYEPLNGQLSTVWFNRLKIDLDAPDDRKSISLICQEVSEMIEKEVANGIPYSRIAVCGFSMGGGLSLHLAFRCIRSLAGCFVMSSFLDRNSLVYEELKINGSESTPPLVQFHGSSDGLIPFEWGQETCDTLKNLGVKVDFIKLKDVDHEIVKPEIQKLKEWISEILPEKA